MSQEESTDLYVNALTVRLYCQANILNRTSVMLSSSLDTPGMHVPSLSDLPVELIDNILCRLNVKPNGYKILGKTLRLNKRISSRAVKYLYKESTRTYARTRRLFDTLFSSANVTTYYPYHFYVEELLIIGTADYTDAWQKLLGKTLECKKLRSLRLSIPRDALLLADLPDCDISFLKDLILSIKGEITDSKALAWMKAMTSRMRLNSLTLMTIAPCSLEFIDLPRNTLSSVSLSHIPNYGINFEFSQALLSSQSESLKSLRASNVDLSIASPVSLPNLRAIHVDSSRLVGWENLCGSLQSLKDLYFHSVTVSGIPPLVSDPSQLETLTLYMELSERWLVESCKSFFSLRTLCVSRISADTLANVLDNCPTLVEFSCFRSADEHLQVFSRPALVSLQSLDLIHSDFTPRGLSAFAEAFPPSITRLQLHGSSGLTPSSFRSLLQPPSLRYLGLHHMPVDPENLQELKEVAKNERRPGLRVSWNRD